ncbi:MAG: EAL domain-containing protein [Proteobacteria bacterium]|nr:EAL domain-containing protein [Pseudomonadota bacterium]
MNYRMLARDKPLALIADDDASLRIPMRAALIRAGFDVIEAADGQMAFSLFSAEKPDLILLDVIMPEMDGFAACAAIRNASGGEYVQILMVTGLDDTASTERAFEAGANDFVSKPINWVMLGHRAKYMHRAGRAYRELNISQQRLAKTQEIAKLGNWDFDIAQQKFFCSPEVRRLLGLESGEKGISFNDFFKNVIVQERDHVSETIANCIKARKPFREGYRIVLPSGQQRHILNQGELLFDEKGEPEILLGAVQDVSQLKHAEEEIRILAFYDALTGLANRSLFLDRLNQEISKAKRHKQHFALLFLDLDQFKRVNDTYGHHIGDLLLKNVTASLQKCIRDTDTISRLANNDSETIVARLGGDEFTVLLSDIDEPENAAVVAKRIINEIPVSYNIDGHDISITTSIGISIFPTDSSDAEELVKYADSAMYHAKDNGRNNYQFFRESFNTAVQERFSLERDIRKALEQDEFRLYYQPQVDLASRKIVGAEALIRWIHPQKGMISPDKFIPIAEESGTIIDINKWVIQTACRENNRWAQLGYPQIRVAINLSGYQFANQNIIKVIQDALKEAHLDAKNLDIEITENILMQDTDETIGILQEMKDLNLRIALDDFGTGYSSLSYLAAFPLDILKIDRSFVMGCTQNKNNLVIIKAIIAMGHSLGMTIVAEGIETKSQLDLMTDFGVDEAQGYYFKPPVTPDEFILLLEQGTL